MNIKVYNRGKIENLKFTIPQDKYVGRKRISIIKGKSRFSVCEVVYVKYATAFEGEAKLDGELTEWRENEFIPVGEKCQVGWPNYIDFRKDIDECYTLWGFKKGKEGIYIGVKAKREISNDRFTVFFDPRNKEELGRVGKYYWLTGIIGKDGTVRLLKGETTKSNLDMKGRWKKENQQTYIEIFIPYGIFEKNTWPESNDLGVSIWWAHKDKNGNVTNLYWSEVGHPWTPKWYGVVRLIKNRKEKIPYMIRIR